jgi:hypothetical protein
MVVRSLEYSLRKDRTPSLTGFSRGQVRRLHNQLVRGGWPSVDSLLARHASLIDIGRASIANHLCWGELIAPLFPPRQRSTAWYDLLIPDLVDQRSGSQTSIITFNYDRTLEHYLMAIASVRLSRRAGIAAIKRCMNRVVHVHGTLGEQWNTAKHLEPTELLVASKSIVVMPEAREDSKEFRLARRLLSSATAVYFLGFGFHDLNMRRLGLPRVLDRAKSGPDIFATRQGIDNRRWNEIAASWFPTTSAVIARRTGVRDLLMQYY